MGQRKYTYILSALILYLSQSMFTSCSGTRNLPAGTKLYTGAKTEIVTSGKFRTGDYQSAAEEAIRPKPNSKILGMRPKLSLYLAAGENPKSKTGKWLKSKGEAPVLLHDVKPSVTAAIIDARLFNMGIFNSQTTYQVAEKKRTAKIIYTIHLHHPYRISSYQIRIPDDSISAYLAKSTSLINTGSSYNLQTLKNERDRIDALLKEKGYFYFNADYLQFKADTISGDGQDIILTLTLKKETPPQALQTYRIGDIRVDQYYSLEKQTSGRDSSRFRGIDIITREDIPPIRPGILLRSVFIEPGESYSRKNHSLTLNRLMSMGNFKFVQMKFKNDSTDPKVLNTDILLTPLPANTFRANMDLVTKSNNYTGPRLNLSWLNRNTFGGAETFKLNLAGSFEAQLNAIDNGLYSYNFNPEIELKFPRLLSPVRIRTSNSLFTPQTTIGLSYNFIRRVNYFDMNNFQFNYGYKWRTNNTMEHSFSPVGISNTKLSNQSEDFLALLEANPYMKKSYEEQFIAGGNYSFTYNDPTLSGKAVQLYFQAGVEAAGNLFSLISNIGGHSLSTENPAKILGSVYSQFVKLNIDGRLYFHLNEDDQFALRLIAGAGKSFGNSAVLPYSRQFFSGGPNSIRAFPINSLGPAFSSETGNIIKAGTFLKPGGDIKLEMNAEYRFGIYSFLKGALFIDAGNVWLNPSNPSVTETSGNPFGFDSFAGDIAVGTGAGIRLDLSFFVLRFDLAFPLRIPYTDDRDRWVVNKIDPFDADWRKQNLLLNIAIGYPF